MSSKIILVERKKNTNDFFIGNFTILTQFVFFLLCFDLFFNQRFSDVTLDQQLIISIIIFVYYFEMLIG